MSYTLIIVTSLSFFGGYQGGRDQMVPTQIVKGLGKDYCEQLGKAIVEMSPKSTYRCV